MAISSSHCEIETIPQDSESVNPDIETSVSETTPLPSTRKSGLLQRFRESVLIKSKAVNMVLFWSTLMYLLYGSILSPDIVFIIPFDQLFKFSPITQKFTQGSISFMNMIGSAVYGVIAVWLLFYPLAGYLADVRYGRYKVVTFGLKLIWFGLLTYTIIYILLGVLSLPSLLVQQYLSINEEIILFIGVVLGAVSIGFLIITYFTTSIGFAAFAANVIQFGIDQLQELPARTSSLFIYWFLMTVYIGMSVGRLLWSAVVSSMFISSGVLGLIWLLFLIAMPISLCVAKSRWFIINPGIGNPYREVTQVVGFARRHKIPIQRSAFTYWEDDIPTGLDLGKSKYGGPFTTEQVENVKAFFGLLYILLSLGPFFTADIAASVFLPILKHHMDDRAINFSFNFQNIVYSVFANGGTLYPLFIVILIPIFLKIVYPLLQRYVPTILKRIGIGLCLITMSLLCSLLVETIGHALPSRQNATSVFNPGQVVTEFGYFRYIDAPSLNLSPYILIVQNFLVAVAYILIYGGVFEFICAQSPHSMKGVLIGGFFAVKGLFQLIGVLVILLPFSFWQDSPRAGLVYLLVNIMISLAGVVVFIVTARRYQYRERDEFCNIREYIEDYYEREIQHNPQLEELVVNFSQDTVPED